MKGKAPVYLVLTCNSKRKSWDQVSRITKHILPSGQTIDHEKRKKPSGEKTSIKNVSQHVSKTKHCTC